MYEFIEAPINIVAFPDLEERIISYKRNAANLIEFVSQQKWGRSTIRVNRGNENKPNITGNLPDALILDSLYRRFRFFILNDGKSNYFRLLRLLSSASDSSLLHIFARHAKRELYKEWSLDFAFVTAKYKYHPKEIINIWFNSYYFHDEKEDIERLKDFEEIVSSNGAKVVLFHAVWNAVLKVRYLSWLLRDTSIRNQIVYVPYVYKLESGMF